MKTFKRILLNILYYYGTGFYVCWAFELGIKDWGFYVQLLIFIILINGHRDIDNFINTK